MSKDKAKTEQFSMRISKEAKDTLELLSKETGLSKNHFINNAIDKYIKEEADFILKMQRGFRQIEAGEVIPHEELMEELRSKWN